MGEIQLFENYYEFSLSAPDSISMDAFDINKIRQDSVISRDKNGKVLSSYKDNVWNLRTYASNPSQHGIIDFENRIKSSNISDAKKLMFLLIVFGSGRNGSQYSIETLGHYFNDVIVPLSDFSIKLNKYINEIIENENYLGEYIRGYCTTRSKNQSLSSFLIFLDRLSNKTTNINYKRSKSIFIQIKQKRDEFDSTVNQTEIIPSRILAESIRQRWIQIDEIENNLSNLIDFLNKYIETERFAAGKAMITHFRWSCNKL